MARYAALYTNGGGDPDFEQIDTFLRTHFNARAIYLSDLAREAALDEVERLLDQKVTEDAADPPANPYYYEALMIFRRVREEMEGSRGEPRNVG